jgi:hypothetical protein
MDDIRRRTLAFLIAERKRMRTSAERTRRLIEGIEACPCITPKLLHEHLPGARNQWRDLSSLANWFRFPCRIIVEELVISSQPSSGRKIGGIPAPIFDLLLILAGAVDSQGKLEGYGASPGAKLIAYEAKPGWQLMLRLNLRTDETGKTLEVTLADGMRRRHG